ncbi:hypothetical protein I7I50_01825 [Histoplasma capsulatum G186AR]|uniref:Uncharacterized protein n=1 Tax=Ajellomyces capsulatus TaxID=5037 RepID=A0A8H8CSV9_AJECA|nr:hypothetical protein I7I52_12039 [Histoplasma capsulatum]QSS71102.1 hypothetical protein I7I50_01825 [Histoplasma capsulatum G186AR]
MQRMPFHAQKSPICPSFYKLILLLHGLFVLHLRNDGIHNPLQFPPFHPHQLVRNDPPLIKVPLRLHIQNIPHNHMRNTTGIAPCGLCLAFLKQLIQVGMVERPCRACGCLQSVEYLREGHGDVADSEDTVGCVWRYGGGEGL